MAWYPTNIEQKVTSPLPYDVLGRRCSHVSLLLQHSLCCYLTSLPSPAPSCALLPRQYSIIDCTRCITQAEVQVWSVKYGASQPHSSSTFRLIILCHLKYLQLCLHLRCLAQLCPRRKRKYEHSNSNCTDRWLVWLHGHTYSRRASIWQHSTFSSWYDQEECHVLGFRLLLFIVKRNAFVPKDQQLPYCIFRPWSAQELVSLPSGEVAAHSPWNECFCA